jgi:UDP-2,3-diacylglucosamine hydrolase
MDAIFVADLHLSTARPEKLTLFRQLLRGPARAAQALYILGDLFDRFWIGNDDRTPPHPETVAELKNFAAAGVPLYLLRGNRELMLDRGIERLTGAVLLPDPALIRLAGKPVLVSHGDKLCTRDVTYQLYRRLLESFPLRRLFPRLPYAVRAGLVRGLTPAFKHSAANKPPEIIDVDPGAVIRMMRDYQVDEMIHGHTHRPAIHALTIDDKPARRIVLGDWYESELILICRGQERTLMSVSDCLALPR